MNPINLNEISIVDRSVAGAKSATLAHLKSMGFKIPDGWVIPVDLAIAISGGGESHLKECVREILADLGDGGVAVRSSAVAEVT